MTSGVAYFMYSRRTPSGPDAFPFLARCKTSESSFSVILLSQCGSNIVLPILSIVGRSCVNLLFSNCLKWVAHLSGGIRVLGSLFSRPQPCICLRVFQNIFGFSISIDSNLLRTFLRNCASAFLQADLYFFLSAIYFVKIMAAK